VNDPQKPDLLIELGLEELPARMVDPAVAGLRDLLLAALDGVAHGAVHTYATPRRLAVVVQDLAASQPFTEREVTGPAADKAFAADGTPTPVGVSFAVGKGARAEDLRVVELPKRGKVAAVTLREGGASVVELIASAMAGIIEKIPFPKKMIWGEGGLSFARPLHYILATYAGEVISGEAHGIRFGNRTVGHRLTPGPITAGNEVYWLAGLRNLNVEPDPAARRARVLQILADAASELGSDPIVNNELVDEVVNLVEWPVGVIGTFDADLLHLPPRLLVTSMRVHQRYFPVFQGGELTNRFVVISNNPFADAEVVAEGNARVLRARFYDARFFLREDQSKTLDAHGEKLGNMRWIRGLGTMADKGPRLGRIAAGIADQLGADGAIVQRAAALAKADLATQMVGEFPELQGHVGTLYARHQGEPAGVAAAIEEHYLPRNASDSLPATPEGRVLAIAERLDVLVGCFGVGIEPSGGGDPQGLRRAAAGLVSLLLGSGVAVDLPGLFSGAISAFQATVHEQSAAVGSEKLQADWGAWLKLRGAGAVATDADTLRDRLVAFTITRFKAAQVERGRSADLVEAAFAGASASTDVRALAARLDALAAFAGTERFVPILLTFKRLLNIVDDATYDVPTAGVDAVEVELLAATASAASVVDSAIVSLDYAAALDAVLALAEPVERFFVGVMVNDPDEAVKARRVGILIGVAAQFRRIADFSRISTR
jgi:glycyl-tRNA synthetase beta chain